MDHLVPPHVLEMNRQILDFVKRHAANEEAYLYFCDELRIGTFRKLREFTGVLDTKSIVGVTFNLALFNETPWAVRRPVYHLCYQLNTGDEYGFILHVDADSKICYTERKDPWMNERWLRDIRL